MSDRCSGHCCKAFVLPYSMDELRRAYEAHLTDSYWWDDNGYRHWGTAELAQIYHMVDVFNYGQKMDHHPFHEYKLQRPQYFYSCRNQLPDGNCGVYASRPQVCSGYPQYGGNDLCRYESCTWDRARGHRSRKLHIVDNGHPVKFPDKERVNHA